MKIHINHDSYDLNIIDEAGNLIATVNSDGGSHNIDLPRLLAAAHSLGRTLANLLEQPNNATDAHEAIELVSQLQSLYRAGETLHTGLTEKQHESNELVAYLRGLQQDAIDITRVLIDTRDECFEIRGKMELARDEANELAYFQRQEAQSTIDKLNAAYVTQNAQGAEICRLLQSTQQLRETLETRFETALIRAEKVSTKLEALYAEQEERGIEFVELLTKIHGVCAKLEATNTTTPSTAQDGPPYQ